MGFFAGTLVTASAARILSPRQIAWAAVALEDLSETLDSKEIEMLPYE